MYFDALLNPDNYYKAFHKIKSVSGWKDSTQHFNLNLSRNILQLIDEIEQGTYKPNPFNVFTLSERGHIRLVKALSVRDSLLQHVLCDSVLVPNLRRYLIYDNGASLKGKGVSFTRARLETHLRKYMAINSTDGYILKVDFRKFFDNIPHEPLIQSIISKIPDQRLEHLLRVMLKAHETDISYITEPNEHNIIFNSLEWQKVPKNLLTGQRFLHKGLGIGAPVSQIAGIFYPTPIDTWCKVVRQCKFYGRYMDDIYIIEKDKIRLQFLLEEIKEQADKLGLYVHPNKTQIIKLSHGFTWLKTKYDLTPSNGILKRMVRDNVIREKRKISHLAKLVKAGVIEPDILTNQFKSWIGDKTKYHDRKKLNLLTNFYLKELNDAVRNQRH